MYFSCKKKYKQILKLFVKIVRQKMINQAGSKKSMLNFDELSLRLVHNFNDR